MAKHKNKFFFNEDTKEKEPKVKQKNVKVKEPKPKKVKDKRSNKKGISFYGEKINYFVKNWLIIIILVILIIIAILFVKGCTNNKNNNKPKTPDEINSSEPVIVDSISINLNQEVPPISEFVKNYDKIKNDADNIVYENQNFVNNKYNSVGNYKVTITLNGKEYISRIVVIDKEAPVFALKDVVITEGNYYTINDFVSSCSDNSGKECALNYEKTEYGKYTSPGTYTIYIIASDLSGNTATAKQAKLTINAKQVAPKPSKTCQYGSSSYTSDHVLTYSLIKNNCAINASYAKTDTYITVPEQMARKDLEKLKEEITYKNISMKIRFDLTVVPILNNEQTGLVGYASYITAVNTANNKTVLSYDINPNGSRKYIINELGL